MKNKRMLRDAIDLALFGTAVKALPNGKVGGYLVRFSSEEDPDLQGEFFTTDTDFGPHQKSLVYYAHALDKTLGKQVLDEGATIKADEVGIWCEAQLDISDAYQKHIYRMAKAGKLGWSSGTASHLVEKEDKKNTKGETVTWIKSWPLGLDASLTPCPVEPRAVAAPIKSLGNLPDFHELLDDEDDDERPSIKSDGFSQYDKVEILQAALNAKLGKVQTDYGYSTYAYICYDGVFESTLVYRVYDCDGKAAYFEAPYTFSNGNATIGDGEVVVKQTKYVKPGEAEASTKSISASLKSLNDLRFGEHSESVQTAVKEYGQRVADYAAIREEKGRRLAPERASEFKGVLLALTDATKAIEGALDGAPDAEAAAVEVPKVDIERLRLEAAANDPALWAVTY